MQTSAVGFNLTNLVSAPSEKGLPSGVPTYRRRHRRAHTLGVLHVFPFRANGDSTTMPRHTYWDAALMEGKNITGRTRSNPVFNLPSSRGTKAGCPNKYLALTRQRDQSPGLLGHLPVSCERKHLLFQRLKEDVPNPNYVGRLFEIAVACS